MYEYNINFGDMEYNEHNGNEYYKGYLENGDILEIRKYGYYGSDRNWEWAVYVEEDFPIQCYQRSRNCYEMPTAESCLENFFEYYKGRNWLSKAEQREQYGPVYYRCLECGWEGESEEVERETVYEDWGDVDCCKCPNCGRIEYEGRELFEEIN